MEMYNTGNPVGSTAPKDLSDNAQVFDRLSVGTDPWVLSRLGQKLWSLYGMNYEFNNAQLGREAAFQQFLADAAFVFIGDYGPGLTFTNRSQYFLRDGVPYRLAPTTTVPYTTTGNWATEVANFSPINSDDVLRQDLGASSGASRVGFVAAGTGTVPTTVEQRLRNVVVRSDYATDAAFNAARAGHPNIDADGNFDSTVLPEGSTTPVGLSRFMREESPNGPRDMLVWAAAQTVTLSGDTWCMGGFRRFGKYVKARAPVFKAPAFQNAMTLPGALAHGMTASTLNNWYATFAVANDGDATASFKIAPFLFVKSVAGSVCTLGRCGEVTDVNIIDNATYTWADNALVGTDILVLNEVFLSGTPSWTMRVAKVTANTAGTVTLDNIGSVGPKCMLLPAPAGWQHYRYCASFYLDTAEVRNMFDGGGGPVRCRMAGTNVVYAHGNNGTNSTYLDGVVPSGTKRIDLSRFIPPLATGVYLQSGYQLASSSFPMRADMFFDMDGSIHTPEVHTFQKDSAEVNAVPLTVFLTFKGGQFYMPSTGGTNASVIARVSQTVTGWFEP